MVRLGAHQLNTVWSWCAVNEEKRRVYFSIWTDYLLKDVGPRTYRIQSPHWGVSELGKKSAARNDQDAKLALVFEKGYEAWGYFIEAKDRAARPREIAHTATSFVVRLVVSARENGDIVGQVVERVEIL